MIDRKSLEAELEEARRVRMEAQAAGGDLEDLIEAMRRSGNNWRGLDIYDIETGTAH
jgi:F0F1-type ATP synthase membrane subunit b/b'